MAKKSDPNRVRLAVDNAEPAPPPPSDGDGRSSRRPPPEPLPPDCPVIPLGMGENVRYYLNGPRQLVTLAVEKHTRLQIMGLFGADADLVHEYWPRKNAKGVTVGWRPEDAAEQLLRLTGAKGLWSPLDKARCRGCWLGDTGGLIVNAGSVVYADGGRHKPGLFGNQVLIARDAIMRPAPAAEPGGANGAGQQILELLECWNWRRVIDARLLLGLTVCALYGAALVNRPVGWIIGPKNTGKSTLQTAINDLMGGWILSVLDPSPASLWQILKFDCLALGIDEAEAQEDNRKLNELVKLARLCYSGGKLTRGGSDGEASEYSLRSAVLFSSIRQPPLLPQDRSRMAVLRLGALPKDRDAPDLSPQRLGVLGARLLRRAIDRWPALADALQQYRIALKGAGHEGRTIEVFGAALAAADIVLNDEAVDTDSAAELAAQLDFASLPEAEDDLSDEAAWLQHLLSCVIPLDGVGGRNSIAAYLRQAVTGQQAPGFLDDLDATRTEADRVLGYYGIKIIRPRNGARPEHFAIANRHAGLSRLHFGTHWAGQSGAIGGWKAAARDLEGAHETTQRFAGVLAKGTAIPLALVLPDDAQVRPRPTAEAEQ